MRHLVIGVVLVGLLVPPLPASGGALTGRSDEGCQAQNPLQPTCSYTVTHTSSTPITGVAGIGDWVVKVKRGKKTLTYKSPEDGSPTAMEIAFKVDDKVKAEALSAGSGLSVGHLDP